jgi:two-component system sensor histidine kinase UhpB
MQDRLSRVPLRYKVLIANVAIVLVGAVFGTWLTHELATRSDGVGTIGLAATFAIIGGVFSIVINLAVVTAALSPLDDIIATAEKVRAGDYSARIGVDPMRDRELEQIVLSFNGALDQVEADRHEIKKLVNSVIEAQEDERKRIARELHDDTSQVLFAQLLRVSAMKMSENPEIREMAEQLETMLAESMEAVRRLGHELRPPSLDDLGLVEATGALVQRMAARSGIEIGFVASGLRERLDPAVELVLYRVAQEALTNMWKHAKATSASVSIRRQNGSVELIIDDNGRGFDVGVENISDGKGLGLGLFGMQERVELVNGNLEVIGNMNPGTRVRARIPLEN